MEKTKKKKQKKQAGSEKSSAEKKPKRKNCFILRRPCHTEAKKAQIHTGKHTHRGDLWEGLCAGHGRAEQGVHVVHRGDGLQGSLVGLVQARRKVGHHLCHRQRGHPIF